MDRDAGVAAAAPPAASLPCVPPAVHARRHAHCVQQDPFPEQVPSSWSSGRCSHWETLCVVSVMFECTYTSSGDSQVQSHETGDPVS